MLLEVCVDSFESAQRAFDNGADRLEICGPLASGGGTSASFALVRQIRTAYPRSQLMVMVRPRAGDFVYSPSELELMADEIDLLKTIDPPIQGVVFGCLDSHGAVDVKATQNLARRAHPLQVTFHRAFDMSFSFPSADSRSPPLVQHAIRALTALQAVPEVTRILTSALAPSMPTALDLFRQLVAHNSASPRPLVLLPGSGLNPTSLRTLTDPAATSEDNPAPSRTLLRALHDLGIREVHASCSSFVDGPVVPEARREGMGMGGWARWEVNGAVVREMRELLDGVDKQGG